MIFSSENIESCIPPLSMESRAVKNNKRIHVTNEASDDNSESAKKSKHSIVSKTSRKDDTLVFDSSTFLLSFASDESVIYCSVYTEKNDDIDKSSNFSPLALLMKSSSEA